MVRSQSVKLMKPKNTIDLKDQKIKCLVANDCEFQLMQISMILRNHKIEVTQAINGLEALEQVTEQKVKFDFIVLDLSMPIMDGYEASKSIRDYLRSNIKPQPRIVACTGHSEPEYIQKAWKYQMDELVAKPANLEVIRIIL